MTTSTPPTVDTRPDAREASGGSPVLSVPATQGKRPLNVLFIIDELCESGGAERWLLKIVRLLPKDQFQCQLLTFKLDRVGIFADIPCPVHVMKLGRTYDLNAVKVAWKIRSLLRSEQIDVVTTLFETSDLWAGPLARLFGVPVLVSSRRDMGILRGRKHEIAYRRISRMFDAVLTVSNKVREFCLANEHVRPERVITLYNGVDLANFTVGKRSEFRARLGISASAPVVATVGHLRHVKGVDIFIEAAARVHQAFPEAVFLVVGDPTDTAYAEQLRQLCIKLQLSDTVRFLGNVSKVSSLLTECDIFCLPSRSEGFSNALVEAMACGLPCVATRVGGNDEAVQDDVSGFIVAPENPEQMADRLLRLLREPALRQQMGTAARATVEEKFTDEVMTRQLSQLYLSLAEAKHA